MPKSIHSQTKLRRDEIDKKRIARANKKEDKRELVRVMINSKTWVYCEAGKEQETFDRFTAILADSLRGKRIGGKPRGQMVLKPYGMPKRQK